MDWVKLKTNYYLDAAIMRAGEAAEVLFTRALAYVGDQETEGVVHREALPRLTPVRGTTRAAALVREGLWEVVPEGWRFTTWTKHQTTRDSIEAKRAAGRTRQALHRQRRNAVTNAVTNASVTGTEVEEEVDAAAAAGEAAAAEPAGNPTTLPVAVEILRGALQAQTPLASLRFDQLRPDQLAELAALVDLHGDRRLVDVAVRTLRHPAPTSVAAFLGTWRSLPPPGQALAVVRQVLCPTHSTVLSPAGVCSGCASDQKAADR